MNNDDQYKSKLTTVALILTKGFISCYGKTVKDVPALQNYLFDLLCENRIDTITDIALRLEQRQRKE